MKKYSDGEFTYTIIEGNFEEGKAAIEEQRKKAKKLMEALNFNPEYADQWIQFLEDFEKYKKGGKEDEL